MKNFVNDEHALFLVRSVIQQVNGTPFNNIDLDDRLISDLEMDSIEMVDFLIHMESIGVYLNKSQLSHDLTVAQILKIMLE